ncbi:hypothetical protein, partial [Aliivibrio logei]|uniref:hypothetical protein n=1 Tax=Aliivibrio logei TaxID=688 RepID=UPI001C300C07
MAQFSDRTIRFLDVKVGWFSFFFVSFWCSFHQVRQLTIIAKISWVSETNLGFNCSCFCLISVCISVLLATFSIPIVARVFGLSAQNWLKPDRTNGVRK